MITKEAIHNKIREYAQLRNALLSKPFYFLRRTLQFEKMKIDHQIDLLELELQYVDAVTPGDELVLGRGKLILGPYELIEMLPNGYKLRHIEKDEMVIIHPSCFKIYRAKK